jgi:hypothetical protein
MKDAQEVFGCITPAIAKFMPWEPPSWSEYVTRCEKRVQAPEPNKFSFVIRRLDNVTSSRVQPTRTLEGRRGHGDELDEQRLRLARIPGQLSRRIALVPGRVRHHSTSVVPISSRI